MEPKPLVASSSTTDEADRRLKMAQMLRESPLPATEILQNLGLYLTRQTLSRLLFMHELYRLAVPVHGIVAEFGVRWGQNLALWTALRGIYEPFNYNRRIVGFDSFSGFPSTHSLDGTHAAIQPGAYGVTKGYESYLSELLELHEADSPIAHIRKHELVKGDATRSLRTFLEANPQTIFALVYFDFDLYEPTRECLDLIRPFVTRGSIIGFDELNVAQFPGETIALREVFGTHNIRLQRMAMSPLTSYFVVE